jgi:hypothetical protein
MYFLALALTFPIEITRVSFTHYAHEHDHITMTEAQRLNDWNDWNYWNWLQHR